MRQVGGDAHLAQDVTQAVFTDLARKAASLSRRYALTGWLYISTRYAAAKTVRAERRRQSREQEAASMHESTPNPDPDWEQLRPVLDEAMHRLSDRDREAVLLRYFQGMDFQAVGAALGLGENAARMRVERALEKLREAPAKTILMREKQPFQNSPNRGWHRTYVFADGHSEIPLSPDGDFTQWESERVAPSPEP